MRDSGGKWQDEKGMRFGEERWWEEVKEGENKGEGRGEDQRRRGEVTHHCLFFPFRQKCF